MIREPIYEAALKQLRRLNGPPYNMDIPVISRDFKHWADSPEQPCVFLVEETETSESTRGLPIKWSLLCTVWVYAKKDGDVLGITKVNELLDLVEAILSPQSIPAPAGNFSNTLGGLVDRCSVHGPTVKSGGYLGDQSVAAMPLQIILA